MTVSSVQLGDQRCITADTVAELPTRDIKPGTPAKVGKDDYEFSQDGEWVRYITGGAASVATSSDSVTAYGNYPETWGDNFTGQAGTNDNDVIYTSPDVTYANNVLIECTAGTVDVYITADGTNYRLATLRTITAAGVVVSDDTEMVSTEHGILKESDVGKFTKFQILQKGATASNARGRYGVE